MKDKNKSSNAVERFKQINEAYHKIKDLKERQSQGVPYANSYTASGEKSKYTYTWKKTQRTGKSTFIIIYSIIIHSIFFLNFLIN